ncbi:heavy-metal-associated domain-containing protein [Sphingomonas mesophila]|uniref:heavy-metal-associated domain-containing protein n=1 Tax=Sphingomonas mesophila TaxID=2303576 RepID=UPI000E57844A|nr:heavy-metal-associated domain-containing protein [Sphingomonas mesophila]
MVRSRRLTILTACAAAALTAGGTLVAQLESGERGILPIDSSGTLEITGIKVDVGGKSAAEARFAGWRIAQREGFKALWAKQHKRPLSEAPTLSDSVLDTLVSSIIVEKEQIGPNRYIAQLGILFDRARAGELLGVVGLQRRSAPMMLFPVMLTGGSMTAVERRNPWQRAWAQFRTSQSPIDYVRPSGLGPDPLLINAAQTRRPGRAWWRNILDYYGAADILIAEVTVRRAYPGGPAVARFVGRHGADGTILGGFTLRAKDSADVPRMMAEGVQRMDRLFSDSLAAGLLVRDTSLITIEPPPPVEEEEVEPAKALPPVRVIQIQVVTPSEQTFASAMGEVRGVPGVTSVSPRSTAIGGWSLLLVGYRGDIGALGSALSARGWAVSNVGGTLRLTPALPPPAQPQPQPPQQTQPSPPDNRSGQQ